MQKHFTNNIKRNKNKYTYYQNITKTLQNPYIHTYIHTPTHHKTHTYTRPHITKQVKTTTVQDTHQIK